MRVKMKVIEMCAFIATGCVMKPCPILSRSTRGYAGASGKQPNSFGTRIKSSILSLRKSGRFATAQSGSGIIAFHTGQLRQQPVAIQRRLLRLGIAGLRPGLRDIDYAAIERSLQFLNKPARNGSINLIAGLRLVFEKDRLWLATWEADLPGGGWPVVPPGNPLALQVPGEVALPHGWRLSAQLDPISEVLLEQALTNADPYQAWLDGDSPSCTLSVRSSRPGERFHPLGMNGRSQKLSDFMINTQMPRRARLLGR